MRKSNFFEWIWINIASVSVTFKYSVMTLTMAMLGMNTRAKMDEYCRRWSSALLGLIDLRWRVIGTMPIIEPDKRYIVMCSHASHYDIPLSFVVLSGSMRMLAKSELGRIPIFGSAMKSAEFVFIDRHNRDRAKRDLRLAKKKMESGIVLWVAPEGTRSRDGKLQPFKKGGFHLAIETQAIIVPVVIRNIITVLPKGQTCPTKGVEVEFVIGEPFNVNGYGQDQRVVLTQKLEHIMRQMLEPENKV